MLHFTKRLNNEEVARNNKLKECNVMQSDVLSIIIIENSEILKYTYSMKH